MNVQHYQKWCAREKKTTDANQVEHFIGKSKNGKPNARQCIKQTTNVPKYLESMFELIHWLIYISALLKKNTFCKKESKRDRKKANKYKNKNQQTKQSTENMETLSMIIKIIQYNKFKYIVLF